MKFKVASLVKHKLSDNRLIIIDFSHSNNAGCYIYTCRLPDLSTKIFFEFELEAYL